MPHWMTRYWPSPRGGAAWVYVGAVTSGRIAIKTGVIAIDRHNTLGPTDPRRFSFVMAGVASGTAKVSNSPEEDIETNRGGCRSRFRRNQTKTTSSSPVGKRAVPHRSRSGPRAAALSRLCQLPLPTTGRTPGSKPARHRILNRDRNRGSRQVHRMQAGTAPRSRPSHRV